VANAHSLQSGASAAVAEALTLNVELVSKPDITRAAGNFLRAYECAESVMVTGAVQMSGSPLHVRGEIIAGPAAVVGFVGGLFVYIALIGWKCPS
jgi:hypothetical protein